MRFPPILLLYVPALAPSVLATILDLPATPARAAGFAVLLAGLMLDRFTGSWLLIRPAIADSADQDKP